MDKKKVASEPTDAVEGRERLVQKRKLNERGGKAYRPTLHIPLTPPQNRRNNHMHFFHKFSPSEKLRLDSRVYVT